MQIYLDCQPISKIVTLNPDLERRAYILQQKQALHAYRLQQLSQSLGRVVTADELLKTEYGKPYLADLAFNHSHSQQHYALVMSHQLQDIGVDVEDLNRKVRFEALAQHAFTAKELAGWYASGQDRQYWFQVWTAKEALVKAAGLGIRLSLNGLETNVRLGQMQAQVSHAVLGDFCYQQCQCHDALLTVAWRETSQVPKIEYL